MPELRMWGPAGSMLEAWRVMVALSDHCNRFVEQQNCVVKDAHSHLHLAVTLQFEKNVSRPILYDFQWFVSLSFSKN